MMRGTVSAVDLALVFAGGMVGTAARYALSLLIPAWGAVPVATFLINVVGAFALGWLIEALTRRGPDEGGRRALRLSAGTGVLGGFTTYSALAVDTDGLLLAAQLGAGVLYALATVILGAVASLGGIAVGAATSRRAS